MYNDGAFVYKLFLIPTPTQPPCIENDTMVQYSWMKICDEIGWLDVRNTISSFIELIWIQHTFVDAEIIVILMI